MKRTKAFALKSYPFREADRVVYFFTENIGLLKGVARGSLKMKSKMAGALEPMTLMNLRYFEPHGRELVIVTGCDAIRSIYHVIDNLPVAGLCGLITEITLNTHAEHDADPAFFRLLELVQQAMLQRKDDILTGRYFEVFSLKLGGLLPPLNSIKNEGARELIQIMLRTNLLELKEVDTEALQQLGNFLRKTLRETHGRAFKSYNFIDQIRQLKKSNKPSSQVNSL